MEAINTRISTAELCRKYRVSPATFGRWEDKFTAAGKGSLLGRDTKDASRVEKENDNLKQIIGEYAVANEALKKTMMSVRG